MDDLPTHKKSSTSKMICDDLQTQTSPKKSIKEYLVFHREKISTSHHMYQDG